MRRLSKGLSQRIDTLEAKAAFSASVALFPQLIGLDEWESLASQTQKKLKDNVKTHEPVEYDSFMQLELLPHSSPIGR